jgi:hypothetical protein
MGDVEAALFRPAIEAAQLVRRKEISARDLTEALLARIEAVNPAITAVVELRAEEALREADAADRANRLVALGARLLGLPSRDQGRGVPARQLSRGGGRRRTLGEVVVSEMRLACEAG